MAGAAVVLADIAERRLEAIHVLYAGARGFGVLAEFDEPRLEVRHVFPNLGAGVELVAGVAVLGIVGIKVRHLRRRILECRQRLGHRRLIVRLFALGHVGEDFGLIAVGLHQRFARFDRVFLGHGNAGAERNGGHGADGEHSTDHVVVSLSGDVWWAETLGGPEVYGQRQPPLPPPPLAALPRHQHRHYDIIPAAELDYSAGWALARRHLPRHTPSSAIHCAMT